MSSIQATALTLTQVSVSELLPQFSFFFLEHSKPVHVCDT